MNTQLSLNDQIYANKKITEWILTHGFNSRLSAIEKKIIFLTRESNDELPTREELSDFLTFQKYWFKLRTNIDFRVSQPISRRSHHLILADLAPQIFGQEINRLMINIAPRYGKTEWAIAILLYSMAYYPHSRWMYISIDTKLVKKAIFEVIKAMKLPQFAKIYGVTVQKKTSDQSSITMINSRGGELYGVSAAGGIAGNGGAVQNYTGFSGGIFIDDFQKIDEVHSETKRDHAGRTYEESIFNRLNDRENGIIICLGQITHEDDLLTRLKAGKHDIYKWKIIELQSLDEHEHALYPEMDNAERLKEIRTKMPYMFSAQHQQRAIPAGGALFKEEFFVLHPSSIVDKILLTWICIDGAETEQTWNDATAMTFFGLYKITNKGVETGEWGIHILDSLEEHIEAGDLEEKFDDFYANCCMFRIKPNFVGIEKKSAGVTLLSVLKKRQGLRVIDTIPYRIKKEEETSEIVSKNLVLKKTKRQLSKTNRFIASQPYWNSRYISATENTVCAREIKAHMSKITANNTHKHDDIADTIADAIFMVYVTGYVTDLLPELEKNPAANGKFALKLSNNGRATWRK